MGASDEGQPGQEDQSRVEDCGVITYSHRKVIVILYTCIC